LIELVIPLISFVLFPLYIVVHGGLVPRGRLESVQREELVRVNIRDVEGREEEELAVTTLPTQRKQQTQRATTILGILTRDTEHAVKHTNTHTK